MLHNNSLPKIYDALEIDRKDGSKLVLEVQSHIGEDTVRTISMDSTDGLSRGETVVATGVPFKCQLAMLFTVVLMLLETP